MSADILHFATMTDAPNRIRELRMQAGLSQTGVADRIGVSKVTISELERGLMRLDLDYMRRIAHALDVAPADLLPLTDNPAALSVKERELIDRLRAASDDQRDQLMKVADVIAPFHHAPPQSSRLRKSAA